ncbi:MAG: DUF115 domain-containing protein [Lachnospiraceae bacterium]|nr:DUF115 domain-containing protein [Lachnospiraceae bacterium]
MLEKELFEYNKSIIALIHEYLRAAEKRYPVAFSIYRDLTKEFMSFMELLKESKEHEDTYNTLVELFSVSADALQKGDMIFVKNVLEDDILTTLRQLQISLDTSEFYTDRFKENIAYLRDKKDAEIIEKTEVANFSILKSVDGYPIIVSKDGVHMQSSINPVVEANILAEDIVTTDCENYIVYGFGNFYIAEAIFKNNIYTNVIVLENNPELLKLGMALANFSGYDNKKLSFVYVKNEQDILHILSEKTGYEVFIDSVSLSMSNDNNFRKIMEDLAVKTAGMREQRKYMDLNFCHLQKKNLKEWSVLKEKIKDKRAFVVAAGPSLDDNLNLLKNRDENTIVISVGTTAKKLVRENITPDIIVVIDSIGNVSFQMQGLEDLESNLVLMSTANGAIADFYNGPKFIAYQRDYKKAEEISKGKDFTLLEPGGSVSGTALQLAVEGKAKDIVLIGFDLAYTNGKAYAVGTDRERFEEYKDSGIKVRSTRGGEVFTIAAFCIYREWIERYLKNNKHPKIYNTGNGSYIEGTENLV